MARTSGGENQELRGLLNLTFEPKIAAALSPARVIADSGGAFVNSILINAGTQAMA